MPTRPRRTRRERRPRSGCHGSTSGAKASPEASSTGYLSVDGPPPDRRHRHGGVRRGGQPQRGDLVLLGRDLKSGRDPGAQADFPLRGRPLCSSTGLRHDPRLGPRSRRAPGQEVRQLVIDLPFALPTIVAGLVLLALYGDIGCPAARSCTDLRPSDAGRRRAGTALRDAPFVVRRFSRP